MNVTPRTVRRKAAAGELERPERGQIDLASLPADAAQDWAARERQKVVTIATAPGQMALTLTVPDGPNLSQADREQAERRYKIIEPLIARERFGGMWAQHGGKKLAVVAFLAAQHKTAARTIYHWLKAFRDTGLPGLVIKDRADKGRPRALNGPALEFLRAAAFPLKGSYGELSVAEIFRAYAEESAWRQAHVGMRMGEFEVRKYARYLDETGRLSAAALLPPASYETFRAWFGRIPEVTRVMARDGVEAYSNQEEVISFRNLTAIQPLDYVVMDHRRLDLFCLIPVRGGWKLARPWVTAAIDMRTRKWLAWSIVETPSSDSIATVLKRVFLLFGLPKGLYWDNGKDFTCEYFEGREARTTQGGRIEELAPVWRGVLETLGVRVHHAIVRRARAKIIEPCFGRTSLYDKSTPWWCGNKPQARPERFDALMLQHEAWLRGEAEQAFPTIAEVAGLYAELMEELNERELHGEGMTKVTPSGRGWMCPNECWEKLIPRVEKRTVPAEVLAFCFARRHEATVRHGEVKATFGGTPYHYRLLGNPQGLMAYNGRAVEFAYDAQDLETVAIYCEARFVGLAGNVELRRMGEQAFVEDEKTRRASRREVKRAIAAAHRDTYVPGIVERAARRGEVRPARIEPGRAEVAAELPAAIMAAAAAAEEERSFDFAAVPAEGITSQVQVAADDGAFDFFGTGGGQA
jgi:transposase InsO family protein